MATNAPAVFITNLIAIWRIIKLPTFLNKTKNHRIITGGFLLTILLV